MKYLLKSCFLIYLLINNIVFALDISTPPDLEKATKEEVQNWLKSYVDSMTSEEKFDWDIKICASEKIITFNEDIIKIEELEKIFSQIKTKKKVLLKAHTKLSSSRLNSILESIVEKNEVFLSSFERSLEVSCFEKIINN